MPLLAIDTETHLIQPGNLRPRLVSVAMASPGKVSQVLHRDQAGLESNLRLRLKSASWYVVGHNLAFDLEVLRTAFPGLTPHIFNKLDAGMVWDTKVVDQLIHIARGTFHSHKYSLADLAQRHLGEELAKGEETWRLRYSELDQVPVDEWPEEAVEYARKDAEVTLRIAQAQMALVRSEVAAWCVESAQPVRLPLVPVDEIHRQVRASYALHIMACEGMHIDPEAVRALRERTETEIRQHEADLEAAGLLTKKRAGGYKKETKVLQARVTAAYGASTPRTAKGAVQTDRQTLLESGDPDLIKMAERGAPLKVLDFLRPLEAAEGKICPRWNVLVASGRTSCGAADSPGNLQNQPRKGGVRECFVPRPGHVFVAADYATAELRALAQVLTWMVGDNAMAKAFREGRDLHTDLANALPWLDRQGAKVANFGLPGGLGSRGLVAYAKATYDVGLSYEQAGEIREAFLAQWSEMRPYFKRVAQWSADPRNPIAQPWSQRLRGNTKFTSAANTLFQGLVADGAKLALWAVTRECYGDVPSPTGAQHGAEAGLLKREALFGCRPVAFIHDEILIEAPRESAPEAATRLVEVMEAEMSRVISDVPIKVEAHIMGRWYKQAEAVYDDSGRLTEWVPET